MNGLESLNVGLLLDYKAEEALTRALKDNLRLSFLLMEKPVIEDTHDDRDETNVHDSSGNVNAAMDFYLRLNRSGRRLLRNHGSPAGLWAHVLENASAHARRVGSSKAVPDVLYFLLREIPEVSGKILKVSTRE
jgi:hypothetical protein